MILLFSDTSRVNSVVQFITVLIIFVLVLGLTYGVTRWVGKYQQGQMYNKNIQVVETFKVTNNKYIQIIKVAQSYLVIAICKDTITLLTELDEEEIKQLQQVAAAESTDSFQDILNKVKKMKPKKWTGNEEDDNDKKKM